MRPTCLPHRNLSDGQLSAGTKKNPKNLRTAPQSLDQSWDHALNAALKRSVDTGKPIRLMRGFMNQGAYAPVRGYRYDGLYQAIRAWEDRSEAGFLICRVALVRLPGQPPLIVHPERAHLLTDAGAPTSVSPFASSIRIPGRVRSFLTFPSSCSQAALSDAASSALSRNSSSSGSAQTDSTKATTPDAESDASEKAPPSKRRRRA